MDITFDPTTVKYGNVTIGDASESEDDDFQVEETVEDGDEFGSEEEKEESEGDDFESLFKSDEKEEEEEEEEEEDDDAELVERILGEKAPESYSFEVEEATAGMKNRNLPIPKWPKMEEGDVVVLEMFEAGGNWYMNKQIEQNEQLVDLANESQVSSQMWKFYSNTVQGRAEAKQTVKISELLSTDEFYGLSDGYRMVGDYVVAMSNLNTSLMSWVEAMFSEMMKIAFSDVDRQSASANIKRRIAMINEQMKEAARYFTLVNFKGITLPDAKPQNVMLNYVQPINENDPLMSDLEMFFVDFDLALRRPENIGDAPEPTTSDVFRERALSAGLMDNQNTMNSGFVALIFFYTGMDVLNKLYDEMLMRVPIDLYALLPRSYPEFSMVYPSDVENLESEKPRYWQTSDYMKYLPQIVSVLEEYYPSARKDVPAPEAYRPAMMRFYAQNLSILPQTEHGYSLAEKIEMLDNIPNFYESLDDESVPKSDFDKMIEKAVEEKSGRENIEAFRAQVKEVQTFVAFVSRMTVIDKLFELTTTKMRDVLIREGRPDRAEYEGMRDAEEKYQKELTFLAQVEAFENLAMEQFGEPMSKVLGDRIEIANRLPKEDNEVEIFVRRLQRQIPFAGGVRRKHVAPEMLKVLSEYYLRGEEFSRPTAKMPSWAKDEKIAAVVVSDFFNVLSVLKAEERDSEEERAKKVIAYLNDYEGRMEEQDMTVESALISVMPMDKISGSVGMIGEDEEESEKPQIDASTVEWFTGEAIHLGESIMHGVYVPPSSMIKNVKKASDRVSDQHRDEKIVLNTLVEILEHSRDHKLPLRCALLDFYNRLFKKGGRGIFILAKMKMLLPIHYFANEAGTDLILKAAEKSLVTVRKSIANQIMKVESKTLSTEKLSALKRAAKNDPRGSVDYLIDVRPGFAKKRIEEVVSKVIPRLSRGYDLGGNLKRYGGGVNWQLYGMWILTGGDQPLRDLRSQKKNWDSYDIADLRKFLIDAYNKGGEYEEVASLIFNGFSLSEKERVDERVEDARYNIIHRNPNIYTAEEEERMEGFLSSEYRQATGNTTDASVEDIMEAYQELAMEAPKSERDAIDKRAEQFQDRLAALNRRMSKEMLMKTGMWGVRDSIVEYVSMTTKNINRFLSEVTALIENYGNEPFVNTYKWIKEKFGLDLLLNVDELEGEEEEVFETLHKHVRNMGDEGSKMFEEVADVLDKVKTRYEKRLITIISELENCKDNTGKVSEKKKKPTAATTEKKDDLESFEYFGRTISFTEPVHTRVYTRPKFEEMMQQLKDSGMDYEDYEVPPNKPYTNAKKVMKTILGYTGEKREEYDKLLIKMGDLIVKIEDADKEPSETSQSSSKGRRGGRPSGEEVPDLVEIHGVSFLTKSGNKPVRPMTKLNFEKDIESNPNGYILNMPSARSAKKVIVSILKWGGDDAKYNGLLKRMADLIAQKEKPETGKSRTKAAITSAAAEHALPPLSPPRRREIGESDREAFEKAVQDVAASDNRLDYPFDYYLFEKFLDDVSAEGASGDSNSETKQVLKSRLEAIQEAANKSKEIVSDEKLRSYTEDDLSFPHKIDDLKALANTLMNGNLASEERARLFGLLAQMYLDKKYRGPYAQRVNRALRKEKSVSTSSVHSSRQGSDDDSDDDEPELPPNNQIERKVEEERKKALDVLKGKSPSKMPSSPLSSPSWIKKNPYAITKPVVLSPIRVYPDLEQRTNTETLDTGFIAELLMDNVSAEVAQWAAGMLNRGKSKEVMKQAVLFLKKHPDGRERIEHALATPESITLDVIKRMNQ